MAKKTTPRPLGRPPEGSEAMTVTVPLRLAADIIETVDRIIDRRDGEGSRNSVLREAIRKGLRVMEDS